jgi:hypothetical protein
MDKHSSVCVGDEKWSIVAHCERKAVDEGIQSIRRPIRCIMLVVFNTVMKKEKTHE